jgi:hypothetical protein
MRLIKKFAAATAPYLFPVGMMLIALLCGSLVRAYGTLPL